MKFIRAIFFLFIFLIQSKYIVAQSYKYLVKEGNKSYTAKEYYAANNYFKKAMELDSLSIDLQYKYASTCRINYDYINAAKWYGKVYKKDNGKEYKECLFWLATSKKQLKQYKEAKKLFERYYKKNKKKADDLTQKALQEIEACNMALLNTDTKECYSISHVDTIINTTYAEISPLEINGKLYFSSNRNNDIAQLWMFDSLQDKTTTKKISVATNNEAIANLCKWYDDKVIVTICKSSSDCKLYTGTLRANNTIETIEPLPAIINEEGTITTQASIGKINKSQVLFFASNRAGTMGGLDIWYSMINDAHQFVQPVNCGKLINSVEDDISPFFDSRNQHLYFSSTWHKGYGGLDIFKSKLVENVFNKPTNLGVPINSTFNDLYYNTSDNPTVAYFVSNRQDALYKEQQHCCNDIYKINIKKECLDSSFNSIEDKTDSAQVLTSKMKLLVPLTLYFHNDEPDNKTLAITTTKNYKETYTEYIKLINTYKKEYTKGTLGAIKEESINSIEHFFEDSVTAGMLDLDSFLEMLAQLMLKNKQVSITMKGFCSPLASTNYNVNLAKRRISSLINYLKYYENGFFIKYIDNGQIKLVQEDIGELKANPMTSDNPNDTKNSIYAVKATIERKIQIIAFELLK